MGTVPLAVLLAPDPDDLVAALARFSDPDFPRRLPRHLLLLPQGLLPGVLPRSRGLRRRRATPRVQGRDQVSFHSTEPPPLCHVRSGGLHFHSLLRRLSRDALARERRTARRHHGGGPARVRRRHRHARDGRQRDSAGLLHVRLPLAPAPYRRERRLLLLRAGRARALRDMARRQRTQPPSHAVCLVLALLGRTD